MPGFGDSAFIVILALLLFGPKKLPVLARQLGKLMADFRRASNEFRSQMEEELRIAEQADRQKQVSALEASTSATTTATAASDSTAAISEPHTPPPAPNFATSLESTESAEAGSVADSPTELAGSPPEYSADPMRVAIPGPATTALFEAGIDSPAGHASTAADTAPVPIATSGELSILPPDTGLPLARAESARSESHNGILPANELESETAQTLHG